MCCRRFAAELCNFKRREQGFWLSSLTIRTRKLFWDYFLVHFSIGNLKNESELAGETPEPSTVSSRRFDRLMQQRDGGRAAKHRRDSC
jgi:hypothetical protein